MGLKAHPKASEQKKMVRLVAEGKSYNEISRMTGRSHTAIETAVKKMPEALEAYQENYRQKLQNEVMPSVERIVKLRDQDKHLPTALAASKDLLDRAEGHLGELGQKKFTIVLNLNQKKDRPEADFVQTPEPENQE